MSHQKLVHLSKNSFFKEVNQQEAEQPLALKCLEDMTNIVDNGKISSRMTTSYVNTPNGDLYTDTDFN